MDSVGHVRVAYPAVSVRAMPRRRPALHRWRRRDFFFDDSKVAESERDELFAHAVRLAKRYIRKVRRIVKCLRQPANQGHLFGTEGETIDTPRRLIIEDHDGEYVPDYDLGRRAAPPPALEAVVARVRGRLLELFASREAAGGPR